MTFNRCHGCQAFPGRCMPEAIIAGSKICRSLGKLISVFNG